MANQTQPHVLKVHGTDPQFLVDKLTRQKIYDSRYWKEECFALTAATLLDKAVALRYIGGCYGYSRTPTPFLCLVLKILQLGPERDIVEEFIQQADFKYVRALGVMYLRLTGEGADVYGTLEPLLEDRRKLRRRTNAGFEIVYLDVFVDELLVMEDVLAIKLPRLPLRRVLVEVGQLDKRKMLLEPDEIVQLQESNEEGKRNEIVEKAGNGSISGPSIIPKKRSRFSDVKESVEG